MALTGFLVNIGGGNAVCADGAAAAIQAIGARFPYVAGSQPLLCSLENSVFTVPNTFTNTILCHDLSGNTDYLKTHAMALMQCDPAFPIGGGAAFDPVMALAFWSFAMTFILGCWIISKNVGLIMSAVRRW